VPDVDGRARERRAGRGIDDGEAQRERRAVLVLDDVLADLLLGDVVRHIVGEIEQADSLPAMRDLIECLAELLCHCPNNT